MPKTTQNFIGKTAIFSNAWYPSFHRKPCIVVRDYAGQFNGILNFRFEVLVDNIPIIVREHELTFLD